MKKNRLYYLVKRKLLGRRLQGILSKVRESDLFLVSYPKSGNTWYRFIIGNLISDETIDFTNFNDVIPDPYQSNKDYLDALENPRIIKSHEPYIHSYPKVIYIYRDPRDVVISYYFWNKKYKNNYDVPIEKYIRSFIMGNNSRYGPWDNHLDSWVNSPLKDSGKILICKYEDMKENGLNEVNRISKFMNIDVTKENIVEALEKSSFNKMKNLEKQQEDKSEYLEKSKKDIKFVRSGGGEWDQYFTEELKDSFKKKFGNMLIKLGYEKDYKW